LGNRWKPRTEQDGIDHLNRDIGIMNAKPKTLEVQRLFMLFFVPSIPPLFWINSRKSTHPNYMSRRSRHELITLLSLLSCVLEHVPGRERERDQRPCE
jgi:hypothetical protein